MLSQADRGVDTAAAVRDARAELRIRKDIYGYDALGWALLADGKAAQAVPSADRSLSLGTQDPRLLVHAGLIHAAAGDSAKAQALLNTALTLSPNFDPVLVARAKAALAQIGAGA